MKIFKKVLLTLIVMLACFITANTISNATATIKVDTNTLNLRQKASTSSEVLTILSRGQECEVIEELKDWYKVKYKTYTGYVSKDYVQFQKDPNTEEKPIQEDPIIEETIEEDIVKDEKITEVTLVTGKISKKSDVKILPLINSSSIDNVSKDQKITIIAEMSGWTYIQTNKISGWVRSDIITNKKTSTSNVTGNATNTASTGTSNNSNSPTNNTTSNTNNNNNNTSNKSFTEKTMYINDSYVNVRKEPSTSSDIVMVVTLNTKFKVIDETGDWYKVETSSGNAYISKKLLSDKKTETTSTRGNSATITNGTNKTQTTSLATTSQSTSNTQNVTTSATTTQTATSVATTSSKGEEIVKYAKKFLGVPYVYGGASKSGFDCSGFTMYVYKHFGITMRHGAQAQAKLGKAIKVDKSSSSSIKKNLQPGDLVFFLDYETMDEIGHCGIYVGNGKFIHATSGTGYCVKINSLLPGEYYNTRFCAVRRVI